MSEIGACPCMGFRVSRLLVGLQTLLLLCPCISFKQDKVWVKSFVGWLVSLPLHWGPAWLPEVVPSCFMPPLSGILTKVTRIESREPPPVINLKNWLWGVSTSTLLKKLHALFGATRGRCCPTVQTVWNWLVAGCVLIK